MSSSSSSSSLRRSIHRQIRTISSTSSPSSFLSATSITANSDTKNPNLLRWISAVTGIGVGVSLYCCYSPSSSPSSTYVVKSAMNFADWLTTTADKVKKFYDGQPLSSSNFFIRGITHAIFLIIS